MKVYDQNIESYSYLLNNRKNITCETLMNKFLGIEERTVTLIEAFTDQTARRQY
ncbi:hypothetical protein [Kaistella solincola]|uniref:hypothetical protein n=1 Tax=Kaistella solincola TaxID=510955 RepID=UPI000B0CECA9|nr:hypothetical protein [Kaistella solincola]